MRFICFSVCTLYFNNNLFFFFFRKSKWRKRIPSERAKVEWARDDGKKSGKRGALEVTGDISRRRNWSAVSNGSRKASWIKTESGPLDLMSDLWEDSFNGRQEPDSRGLKSEMGRVQLAFQVAWQCRERVTETVALGNIRSSRSSFPWRQERFDHAKMWERASWEKDTKGHEGWLMGSQRRGGGRISLGQEEGHFAFQGHCEGGGGRGLERCRCRFT